MHRLPIFQDTRSFDERTEKLLKDVRKQIDSDLQNFGFGQKNKLLSTLEWGRDDDEKDPTSKLLSQDFFKLKPSKAASLLSSSGGGGGGAIGGSSLGSRLSSPPRKDDFGSHESLNEDATKRLYVDRGLQNGRMFCVSFDVKDYDAEDISVTVEENVLTVQAKHKTEKGGAVSIKEFNRKMNLPKDVDPEKLISTMTSDGILTIEAQVPPAYSQGASPSPPLSGASQNGGLVGGGSLSPASPQTPVILDTPIFSNEGGSAGRRRMDLVLEIGSPYTPEDISVKLEGNTLYVEATHEEKSKGKTSKVSMQRDFDLTEDVDVSTVQALLKSTGQLTITAYVQ